MKVLLSQLRPGWQEGVNARLALPTAAELAPVKASIAERGVLVPMLTWQSGGLFYAVDGDQRLESLLQLQAEGHFGDADPEVDVVPVVGTKAELLELSLAVNDGRIPLHPVDRYEVFAKLIDGGLDAEYIGRRFRLSEREVTQSLALSAIADPIRAAWRAGEIGEGTAQAFTLVTDHGLQVRVMESLRQSIGTVYPHDVRRALTQGAESMAGLLTFVGREVYEAAGGKATDDLFRPESYVWDAPLLRAMARDALQGEIAGLIGAGWAWAMLSEDAPPFWYQWQRLDVLPKFTKAEEKALKAADAEGRADMRKSIENDAMARACTAQMRAQSGCLLSIAPDGKLVVLRGFVKPEAPAQPSDDGGHLPDATEPESPIVAGAWPPEPKAAVDRLRMELSTAIADALATQPEAATDILTASLLSGPHGGSPVVVRSFGAPIVARGWGDEFTPYGRPFAECLTFVSSALSCDERDRLLAALVAAAVDATTNARRTDVSYGHGVQPDAVDAVLGLLTDGGEFIRAAWDASAYFAASRKEHAVLAVREALGPDKAAEVARMKAGAAAEYAAEHVPPWGWLPPELRYPGYGGPVTIEPAAEDVAEAEAPKPQKKKTA